MRQRDKKKILGFYGFLNHRKTVPGMGFVTNALQSWKAIDEFWTSNIPCISIVDSNVLSWGITLPIPGNDDSILCLNYYCYMVARGVILTKAKHCRNFRNVFAKVVHRRPINLRKKLIISYIYKHNIYNSTKFTDLILNNLTAGINNIGESIK